MGLEPTTFCMASRRSSQLSYIREAPRVYRRVGTLLQPSGDVAEWLRSGLQSRLHRFDSGRRLRSARTPSAAPPPLLWVRLQGPASATRARTVSASG